MILLAGIATEAPLALVRAAAEAKGLPTVLLNQREIRHLDLRLECSGSAVDGTLFVQNSAWSLSCFTGIYVRLMDHRFLPEVAPRGRRPADRQIGEKNEAFHSAFNDWLEVADCRVMNRNLPSASNMSKPYQAQAIARCGFKVPETLITNDPSEARAFHRQHRRVIFKSISAVRSIVRELDRRSLAGLDRIRVLPTQFQAFVPGTNVRVHVAGSRLFASEIRSEAVDYRYAGAADAETDMRVTELPDEIAERCFQLSHELELPLCGIDLKRTPSGDYYCFEVNPSPAYSYYEERTGQPIAAAIVDYLAGG